MRDARKSAKKEENAFRRRAFVRTTVRSHVDAADEARGISRARGVKRKQPARSRARSATGSRRPWTARAVVSRAGVGTEVGTGASVVVWVVGIFGMCIQS